MPDLASPSNSDWSPVILAAIEQCTRPVVLVSHSLGAIATVHAAQHLRGEDTNSYIGPVRAALLVSPPAAETLSSIDRVNPNFLPIPSAPLPFPSLVVGSVNDPFASQEELQSMALDWGSDFTDAGEAGHINVESGHGPWPEGLMRFAAFMRGL